MDLIPLQCKTIYVAYAK